LKKIFTIDEIIDKKIAVLLDREDETNKLNIPLNSIPVKVKEGDIIEIEFENDVIINATVDNEATRKELEEMQKMLDELKNKGSRDLKW
jgi:hypothetical protein